MNRFQLCFVGMAAVLALTSNTHAALIITLGRAGDAVSGSDLPLGAPGAPEGPFFGGDSFSLGVFAHETEAGAVNLDDYNLLIDFEPLGLGAGPGPFNVTDTSFTAGPAGSYTGAAAPTTFADFGMGFTSGTSFQVSDDASAPTLLFTVDVDIDAGAAAGIYDLNVVTPDGGTGPYTSGAATNFGLFRFRNNGADTFAPIVFDQGQIQISAAAVPEPSSILAFTGVFAVGGVRQWRRRRGAAEAVAA